MQDRKEDLSKDHMPWVKRPKESTPCYFQFKPSYFQSGPREINASPDVVWEFVKDIENYDKYSNQTIVAHIEEKDKQPAVGKHISMTLYDKDCMVLSRAGIPSVEKISVVDEQKKVIGWERELPGGEVTERYQVLEPTDGGKKTRSYIALRIPGCVGFFTSPLKGTIEKAFNEINKGIQKAAEDAEAKKPSRC